MPKAISNQVQQHLNDIESFNSANFIIVSELRNMVFDVFPDIEETVKYDGLMYKVDVGIGGIFTYKNHVSFEFSNGVLLEDKYNLLDGSGKFRRHLKFDSVDSINTKHFSYYIKQYLK